MHECSKAVVRRISDPAFAKRYLVGRGIDIGGGPDPLDAHRELFPLMTSCRTWDRADGDAQYMAEVADNHYDFVHSSHCLEHMRWPALALRNWLRILKPGGHLVCIVPDEDLYEQGVWPSSFNGDHKATFTIHKATVSWSPVSVNLLTLLASADFDLLRIVLLDAHFDDSIGRIDQTLGEAESAIEFVIRKR